MKPWILLDTARIPGSDGELRLYQRDQEFMMWIDGTDLMNSRAHASEEALAELACSRLGGLPRPHILIGGLGMGFTLAEALRRLGPDAKLTVAELVPAVLDWNRRPLGHLAGHPLKDSRVTVVVEDVARILMTRKRAFDAILMDVDNGPVPATRRSNDWLYSDAGLDTVKTALKPGGVLAQWSTQADRSYVMRLRKAGFDVREAPVRGRKNKGAHHKIWISTCAS